MKKRYCVTYVGNDSCNHRMIVWAHDHNGAIRKVDRTGKADMIASVRRTANPFVILGIALVVLALVLIEIVN